ncbi:UNVERIFIED_CONTAM: hypothetical protein FKN15_046647 [Acipenser sinensis]
MDHDGLGDRERGVRNGRRRYEEEEDEDHHSMYIGVPEPRGYRRKRRRRRSTSSRDNGEGERERHYERARQQQTQPSDTDEGGRGHSPTPAAMDDINRTNLHGGYRRKRRRRRSTSSRDNGEGERERNYERARQQQTQPSDTDEGGRGHSPTPAATDDINCTNPSCSQPRATASEDNAALGSLQANPQAPGQTTGVAGARWVKFEEKVEEGGERWSKPHVSTLSLHSLFELRTCLQTGTVLLDLEGYSLPQIIDDIIEKQVEDGLIKAELRDKISFVLLRKHRHQTKKPIHRSLADMGKSVSSPSNRSPIRSPSAGANLHRSSEDLRTRQAGSYGRLLHAAAETQERPTATVPPLRTQSSPSRSPATVIRPHSMVSPQHIHQPPVPGTPGSPCVRPTFPLTSAAAAITPPNVNAANLNGEAGSGAPHPSLPSHPTSTAPSLPKAEERKPEKKEKKGGLLKLLSGASAKKKSRSSPSVSPTHEPQPQAAAEAPIQGAMGPEVSSVLNHGRAGSCPIESEMQGAMGIEPLHKKSGSLDLNFSVSPPARQPCSSMVALRPEPKPLSRESITLHLKISCPSSSPAVNYSRSAMWAVPQVKIEMESDYEDTDRHPRDMGSETTL